MIDPAHGVDHDPCQTGAALIQRKAFCMDSIDARTMDKTSAFDQLLQGAAAQPEPQRLVFVFATADLPEDATPAQRQRFAAGYGGTLEPVICVDKGPGELASFDALVTECATESAIESASESRVTAAPWHVVFAAGLSGRNGQPPSGEQVDEALQAMIERVRSGRVESLLALDKTGQALQFV